MARGTEIIVSANPQGEFTEGTIIGTPKPGTVMEIDATAAIPGPGGRMSYRVYQPGTDGQRRVIWILLPDSLQGKLNTDAYVTGTRGFLYCPRAGEQFNMLLGDVAGTADDHTKGETLEVDTGTGKLIAHTGSPEADPFRLLETVTDPVADTLAWVEYTGY